MATFTYKGIERATGSAKNGTIEAADEKTATGQLRQRGILVSNLSVAKKGGSLLDMIPFIGGKNRLKTADLTMMTRQMATLIQAGLPLLRALSVLEEQALEGSPQRTILGDIRNSVQGGGSFSDALRKFPDSFDKLYVSMVKAGEIGGVLEVVLERLADFGEKEQALKTKVKSAMIYPAVISSVAIIVVCILMIYVIPQFAQLFDDMHVELPFVTKIVMGVSDFIRDWWMVSIGGGFAAFAVFKKWAATTSGREIVDTYKLKVPIFGPLIKKVIVARFTRTMGTLIRSGVPILQALDIVKETANNTVIEKAIAGVSVGVTEGESIAVPLSKTGVFPGMVTNMIAVGEETGALDEMLIRIADNYDMIVDEAVRGLTSAIEPVIIVVMGIVVGVIVSALFMPMFKLTEVVHNA